MGVPSGLNGLSQILKNLLTRTSVLKTRKHACFRNSETCVFYLVLVRMADCVYTQSVQNFLPTFAKKVAKSFGLQFLPELTHVNLLNKRFELV